MLGVTFARLEGVGSPLQYVARPLAQANSRRNVVRNLQFQSGIQNGVGGDQAASFDVLVEPYGTLFVRKGDLVFLHAEGQTEPIWAGVVIESPRIWGQPAGRRIVASGTWKLFQERLLRFPISDAGTVNLTEPLGYALRALGDGSKVAIDLTTIGYTDTDLGAQWAYTQYSQYLTDLIQQYIQYGTDDTVPIPLGLVFEGWSNGHLGMFSYSDFAVTIRPPIFNTSLAGAGVVDFNTTVALEATMSATTAVADAAIMYDNNFIQRLTNYRDSIMRYHVKGLRRGTGTNRLGYVFAIVTNSFTPAVAAQAVWDATRICDVWVNGANDWLLTYVTDAGVVWYWNQAGGVWQLAAATFSSGVAFHDIFYEHDSTGFKFTIYDSGGALVADTTVVPWSTWTTKDTDQLWALAGVPYTDTWSTRISIDLWKNWRMASGSRPRMFEMSIDDAEYVVDVGVAGQYQMTDPDELMANAVVASYGDPVGFTAIAQDTDSIAKYGTRDLLIDTGAHTSGTAALRTRDKKLGQAAEVQWQSGNVSIRGNIRRKNGALVPAYTVKCGERVRLTNTLLEEGGLTFLVGSVTYNDANDVTTLAPADLPDSIDLWLAQLAARAVKPPD